MTANSFLEMLWRESRNDASPYRQKYWEGAIEALHSCGMLNDLEAEAWRAYCGDLKADPVED